MADLTRRWFVAAVPAIIAAPAIVRFSSLMPVRTPIVMGSRLPAYEAATPITFTMREEALTGLHDWWTTRIDTSFFNELSANG